MCCFKYFLEFFCTRKSIHKEFENLNNDSLDETILLDSELHEEFRFGKIVILDEEN
jgi:hypothetical protein